MPNITRFTALVEGLIKERQIAGRVKGFKGNSVFVPRVYHDMQLGYVDSFFTQNGYFGKHDLCSRCGLFLLDTILISSF